MNSHEITIVGKATGDAKKRTPQNGDVAYATFDVTVCDEKDGPTFFPVVVFGDQSENVAKYVTKDREVLVAGRVRISDQGCFSVVADAVCFGINIWLKSEVA